MIHTENAWAKIEATLLSRVNYEPRSLEAECPHIVNDFLILMRTLHTHTFSLVYIIRDLTLNNILDIAQDRKKSVV